MSPARGRGGGRAGVSLPALCPRFARAPRSHGRARARRRRLSGTVLLMYFCCTFRPRCPRCRGSDPCANRTFSDVFRRLSTSPLPTPPRARPGTRGRSPAPLSCSGEHRWPAAQRRARPGDASRLTQRLDWCIMVHVSRARARARNCFILFHSQRTLSPRARRALWNFVEDTRLAHARVGARKAYHLVSSSEPWRPPPGMRGGPGLAGPVSCRWTWCAHESLRRR